MFVALAHCMTNYAAAHRARESTDIYAAQDLVLMLRVEVPRLRLALRPVSKNHIWPIVAKYINEAIPIAMETHSLTHTQ